MTPGSPMVIVLSARLVVPSQVAITVTSRHVIAGLVHVLSIYYLLLWYDGFTDNCIISQSDDFLCLEVYLWFLILVNQCSFQELHFVSVIHNFDL